MSIRNASWYGEFALNVAIFSSLMAVTLGVVYCACRIGFPINYHAVLRTIGMALLILNVAPFGRGRWFAHPVALVLSAMVGVGLISWFLETLNLLGWFWTFSGAVLFVWNLIVWISSSMRSRWAALFIFAAALICGLYASGKTWGLGYNNPLAEERLLINRAHIDALFHSSISNMIRTYGRPSTGLDGLPYIAYHYGSHWLVAALAPMCGMSVFDLYNSGTGIIFIPLMFASLLLLAGAIRDAVRTTDSIDLGPPGGYLFWLVVIAGMLGPFPKKGDMMRVSLTEIYDSDSYALGLAISFMVITLAVTFYREWNESGRPLDLVSRFAWIVVFPTCYCLCAVMKVSTAYLLFGMAAYACVRLGLWRLRLVQLHLVISFAALLCLSRFIASRGDARLSFFTFDRIHPEWIPFFLVFYFFWVWVFLGLRAYQMRLVTLGDVRAALSLRRTLPTELLLFCMLIGLVPYLALRFETGSWNYFTQYQTFVGMALTAAYLPSRPHATAPVAQRSLWAIPVRTVFVAVFAALFCLHLSITVFGSVYGLVKTNAELRAELAGYPPDAWRRMLHSLYGSSRGMISPALQPRQEVLSCLQSLGRMPHTQKRNTILYIPKSNREYWGELRQKIPGEGAISFLAPAMTGMAMIAGEPEFDDLTATRRLDYGFWSYPLPTRSEPAESITANDLVARAKALGFDQIITIQDSPSDHCTIQLSRL